MGSSKKTGAKIGISSETVIVDHWHWSNCLGGYCGLPQGQTGMPLKGGNHPNKGHGPGTWAYNTAAANSLLPKLIRANSSECPNSPKVKIAYGHLLYN
jgi:hypothetical protein